MILTNVHFIVLSLFLLIFCFIQTSSRSVANDENNEKRNSTLVLLQAVFRHGQRTPAHTYKNDLYKEDSWPQGFGQLTQEGMRQVYRLGQLFRRRYIEAGFLNVAYNRTEVHIRSTDKDRTLMSAYCFMAGLYPPNGTQQWNPDLLWQPIPVHTVPLNEDYLLSTDTKCPKYEEANTAYMMSDTVKSFIKDYKDLMNTFANFSGESATVEGMFKIIDPLYCEKTENRTIPAWAESRWDIIMHLYDIMASFGSLEMAKLRGGLFLHKLLTNMQMMKNDTLQPPRAFFFSAHDSTIIALLKNLKVYNNLFVQLASTVIVELHKVEGSYKVKVMYRNETDCNDTVTLQIPDCEELCPLEKFATLIADMTFSDAHAACFSVTPADHNKDTQIAVIVLACLVVLLLVLIMVIIILKCRKRNQPSDYSLVSTVDDDTD